MGIEFPRVTKCCFCVPLRIASLLIGYVSILASCFILSAVAFYTYKVATFVDEIKENPNPEHTPEEVHRSAISLYISFAYYMLVFVFNIVIHVLLLIGVHTNKPRYLRLYCNTAYFLFALAVVLVVLTCIFMGFIATLPILKWTFTIAACIVVVRSTCLEMEEQMKPPSFIEMQNLYIPERAPQIA